MRPPKGTSLAGTTLIDVKYVGLERAGSAVGLPEKSPEKNKNSRTLYHLLHGSASNVVRTGRSVNGNRPKLTPYGSETP
jgi:hypothetical protein